MEKITVYLVYRWECEYEGLPEPTCVTRHESESERVQEELRALGYSPAVYTYEI